MNKFIDGRSLTIRVTDMGQEKTRMNFMVLNWNWRFSSFSV